MKRKEEYREIVVVPTTIRAIVWEYPSGIPPRINSRIKKVLKDFFEKGRTPVSIDGFNFIYKHIANNWDEVWVYQQVEHINDALPPTIFKRIKEG